MSTPSAAQTRGLQARLRAASRPCDRELVEALHSALVDHARAVEAGTLATEDSLYDDPFLLISVLAPLLHLDKGIDAKADSVHGLLLLVAQHASPREVLLALEEYLARRSDVDGSGDEDSLDDDDDDDDLSAGPEEVAKSLVTFAPMLSRALSRLKTAKPATFLLNACDSLTHCLEQVVRDGAFALPQPTDDRTDDSVALDLFEAMSDFYDATVQHLVDRVAEREREDARETIRYSLRTVVGLLHPYVGIDIADEFFLSRHEKYRRPGFGPVSSPRRKTLWRKLCAASLLSESLDYRISDLFVACRRPSAKQAIGSFVLLVHILSSTPETPLRALVPDDTDTASVESIFSKTLPLVRAPFVSSTSGSSNIADDEVLFWLWWCLERREDGLVSEQDDGLETDVLYPIIEIASSIAALSPFPRTRFLAFQLLTHLVRSHTGRATPSNEALQLDLLRELVTTYGTPSFQTACIGIVKDVLADKLERADKNPSSRSLFLSTRLVDEFGPVLLRAHCEAPLSEVPLETFLRNHQRGIVQRLNWYYFVLERDCMNKTGIRSASTTNATESAFLSPLRTRVSEWLSVAEDPGDRLDLEIVREGLSRIDGTLSRLLGLATIE
ncbi:hypothetical protein JCM10212_003007 [Sporobolomyces blumeae]